MFTLSNNKDQRKKFAIALTNFQMRLFIEDAGFVIAAIIMGTESGYFYDSCAFNIYQFVIGIASVDRPLEWAADFSTGSTGLVHSY